MRSKTWFFVGLPALIRKNCPQPMREDHLLTGKTEPTRQGYAAASGGIGWDTSKTDGAARKLLDSTRFKTLGWKPEMEFENGFDLTYDWFEQNYSTIICK